MAAALRRMLPFLVALACAGVGLFLRALAGSDVGSVLEEPNNGAMGDWLLGASQPGRWLIAMAIVLALLATARALGPGTLAPLARFAPPVAIAGAGALALLSLRGLADAGKHATLGGAGDVWWLDDDMMITLRYARNLVEGHGLVWNAGERVEGITNFLWALLLAIPQLLLGPNRAALGAIVANAVLLVSVIALTFALVRRLGGSRLAATLAAFALATHQGTLHWAAGGSEALLLAALLLVAAWCACGEGPATRRESTIGALCGGLALLTRPDALPVVAIVAVALLLRIDGRRERGRAIALLAALPLAQLIFRLAYYGDALPNTYYLKMTGWSTRPLAGVHYVVRLLSQHALHVAMAVAALLALRPRASRVVLAALVLQFVYVAWAGGDELPKQRFFVPIAPLLFAMSMVGAEALAHRIGGAPGACPSIPDRAGRSTADAVARSDDEANQQKDAVRRSDEADASAPPDRRREESSDRLLDAKSACDSTCQPLWLPWSIVALAGLGGGFVPGQDDPGAKERSNAESACVQQGLLIRENTTRDAAIGVFWAGATIYFSERRGVDLLGKCDRTIARLEAKPGLMRPGHNKWDFERSLALGPKPDLPKPDVIVGGLGGSWSLPALGQYKKTSPYRCFAEIYSVPGFAEYVGAAPKDVGNVERMPQLVGGAGTKLTEALAATSINFHAIFVRRGTTRARPPADWVAPPSDANH